MKTFKNIISSNYFVIFIISLILFLFLVNIPISQTHDGLLHILRIIGVDMSISANEFPPIINAEFCRGFGYAINLFYGSLVTYGPLLIKLFLSSYSVALKAFTFLTIFLSGIFMHKFIFQITNKKLPALFGSIIYILAPYKLTDIYIRFAIGEFTAFVFIPLVFLGLYSLLNQDGKKHYYIAIGAIGLILTHTISAMYTAIFCAIYLLFNVKKLKNIVVVKKIILNVVFILLISAFFTVPLIGHKLETDYIIFDAEIMNSRGIDANLRALNLSELIVGYQNNFLTFKFGMPLLVTLLSGIFIYKKIDRKYFDLYIIFILFSFISTYMATKYFPWKIMPNIISLLQFPWRMLGFAVFFMSFICGVNLYLVIEKIKEEKAKTILISCIIITMIVYVIPILNNFNNYYISKNQTVILDNKLEEDVLRIRQINHYNINREYLPLKAYNLRDTYMFQRNLSVIVLQGDAEIKNTLKQLSTLTFDVRNVKENTILELPYIYYLGYDVTLTNKNNEKTKINTFESNNGFVAINLENINEGSIKVEYTGTIITKISYIVSSLSFIIFVFYIIKSRGKNEKVDKK